MRRVLYLWLPSWPIDRRRRTATMEFPPRRGDGFPPAKLRRAG